MEWPDSVNLELHPNRAPNTGRHPGTNRLSMSASVIYPGAGPSEPEGREGDAYQSTGRDGPTGGWITPNR